MASSIVHLAITNEITKKVSFCDPGRLIERQVLIR